MRATETDRKIGENIRRIREQKGISKELYAQRLQKSTEYVTAIENGEKQSISVSSVIWHGD